MQQKQLIRELRRELSRVEGLLIEEPDSTYLQRRRLSIYSHLKALHTKPSKLETVLVSRPPDRSPVLNHVGNLVQVENGEVVGAISPKSRRDRGEVVTWAIYLEDTCNGFHNYDEIQNPELAEFRLSERQQERLRDDAKRRELGIHVRPWG